MKVLAAVSMFLLAACGGGGQGVPPPQENTQAGLVHVGAPVDPRCELGQSDANPRHDVESAICQWEIGTASVSARQETGAGQTTPPIDTEALAAADRIVGLGMNTGLDPFQLVHVTASLPVGSGVIGDVMMPGGVLMGASTVDAAGGRYFTIGEGLLQEVSLQNGHVTTHPAQGLGSLLEYDPVGDAILSVGWIPGGNRLMRLTLSNDALDEVARFENTGVSQGVSAFDPVSRRYFIGAVPEVPQPGVPWVHAVDVDTGATVRRYRTAIWNFEYNAATDSLVGLEYSEAGGGFASLNLVTSELSRGEPIPEGAYQGSSTLDQTGRWYFFGTNLGSGPVLRIVDTVSGAVVGAIPIRPANGIEYVAPPSDPR